MPSKDSLLRPESRAGEQRGSRPPSPLMLLRGERSGREEREERRGMAEVQMGTTRQAERAAAAAEEEEQEGSSEDEDIWRSSQRAAVRIQGRLGKPTAAASGSASAGSRRGDSEEGGRGEPTKRSTYGQHVRREVHSSEEFNLDADDELMLQSLASTDTLLFGAANRLRSDDLNAVD